jgi:curved DNA-binding protein CbpA
MKKKQLSPYELLGVRPSADAAEIKAAYRTLAKVHHPDAGGDGDRFAEITLAYDVLMDPARRKLYDETGRIEDEPVDAKNQQARQVLYDMVAHALMGDPDPTSVNLVFQMESNLQQQIAATHKQNHVLKRALDRATKMEKRFVRKSKKEPGNIFVDMLKHHQQRIGDAMAQNERTVEVKKIALDIVRQYGFKADMPQQAFVQMQYFSPGGGGTASGHGGGWPR